MIIYIRELIKISTPLILLTKKQKRTAIVSKQTKKGGHMSYSKLLLSQFAELYEKQDISTKLTSKEFLHGYGYSEL